MTLMGAASAWAGRYYVVDDGQGGVKMYDVLPPELASRGYRIVDERGVTLKVVPPRQERARPRLDARDRALLATFANESELIIARDRQLATLEGLIRLNERNLPLYEANLKELQAEVKQYRRAGKSIPERLREDIERVQRQIKERRDFIRSQRRELEQVRARYDADIRRFRELKAGGY